MSQDRGTDKEDVVHIHMEWWHGGEESVHAGDTGSIPGSGRSHGAGNGNPLQYCCLGNSMNRGAWGGYSPWHCRESDTTE